MKLFDLINKLKTGSRTIRFMLLAFIFLILFSSSVIIIFLMLLLFALQFGPLIMLKPQLLPILTLAIFIFLATILSMIISKHVLHPINDLIYATKEVSKGNFKVQVNHSDGESEIHILQKSFNHMVKELDSIEMFRNDFINEFSHEFKTPIVSIRGFAKQLKNDNIDEAQKNEYIDIIISECNRLANMSTNVLLLSKYESQQIISNQSDFYMDEQIRKCILLLEKEWSDKNINLDLDLVELIYHSDEEMISQVWINLLSNAIKFTPKNGTISVSSSSSGDNVVIKISDTGIGMDTITVERIFDKFYQGDNSHSSVGNGLGLSIVKRIVDLCNGHIDVESSPSKGTTFTVSLPC